MLFDDDTGEYLGVANQQQCDRAAMFARRVLWIDETGALSDASHGGRKVRIENHPKPSGPPADAAPPSPVAVDEPAPLAVETSAESDTDAYAPRQFLRDAGDWLIGVCILLGLGVVGLVIMWLTGEGITFCAQGSCQ